MIQNNFTVRCLKFVNFQRKECINSFSNKKRHVPLYSSQSHLKYLQITYIKFPWKSEVSARRSGNDGNSMYAFAQERAIWHCVVKYFVMMYLYYSLSLIKSDHRPHRLQELLTLKKRRYRIISFCNNLNIEIRGVHRIGLDVYNPTIA